MVVLTTRRFSVSSVLRNHHMCFVFSVGGWFSFVCFLSVVRFHCSYIYVSKYDYLHTMFVKKSSPSPLSPRIVATTCHQLEPSFEASLATSASLGGGRRGDPHAVPGTDQWPVQRDNTPREVKNNLMLKFLAALVANGMFRRRHCPS